MKPVAADSRRGRDREEVPSALAENAGQALPGVGEAQRVTVIRGGDPVQAESVGEGVDIVTGRHDDAHVAEAERCRPRPRTRTIPRIQSDVVVIATC